MEYFLFLQSNQQFASVSSGEECCLCFRNGVKAALFDCDWRLELATLQHFGKRSLMLGRLFGRTVALQNALDVDALVDQSMQEARSEFDVVERVVLRNLTANRNATMNIHQLNRSVKNLSVCF